MMVHTWNINHSKPNPYEEVEEGECLWIHWTNCYLFPKAVNFKNLRKELAEEEMWELDWGEPVLHKVLAQAFIHQAFSLQDQQCVHIILVMSILTCV
jgi:hypothetical protein